MRVHLVCTANICRSPLAEHLLRRALAERGLSGVEALSSGLFANPGTPTVEAVLRAGRAAGLDLSQHLSRRFDPRLVDSGDLVLVMEVAQRQYILDNARLDPRDVRLLGRFEANGADEVADPFGGTDDMIRSCVARLAACVDGVATWLEEERISRA